MTKSITTAQFKGRIVTVGATVKGWTEVTYTDGEVAKARAKDLTDVSTSEVTDTPEGRKNGVVKAKYLSNYAKTKLANGAVVRDNGDEAAQLVRGLEIEEIFELVSKKIGVSMVELQTRWSHLNPGMARMCAGNVLRKALRDADKEHVASKK